MKKIFCLISFITVMILSSCKKDYTCTCITKDSADPTYNGSSIYMAKMKKKEADTWCAGYKVDSGTRSTSCSLN
jgi:hypothetical protein